MTEIGSLQPKNDAFSRGHKQCVMLSLLTVVQMSTLLFRLHGIILVYGCIWCLDWWFHSFQIHFLLNSRLLSHPQLPMTGVPIGLALTLLSDDLEILRGISGYWSLLMAWDDALGFFQCLALACFALMRQTPSYDSVYPLAYQEGTPTLALLRTISVVKNRCKCRPWCVCFLLINV